MDYKEAWETLLDELTDTRNSWNPGSNAYGAVQRLIDRYGELDEQIEAIGTVNLFVEDQSVLERMEEWLNDRQESKAEAAKREPCGETSQDLGAQAYAFGCALEQLKHFRAEATEDCGDGTSPEDSGPELTPDETGDPDNPSHYSLFDGAKETMDLIRDRMDRDWFAGYLEGNAIKYMTRWKHKHDELEGQIADLKKCRMYIDLLIETLEDRGGQS